MNTENRNFPARPPPPFSSSPFASAPPPGGPPQSIGPEAVGFRPPTRPFTPPGPPMAPPAGVMRPGQPPLVSQLPGSRPPGPPPPSFPSTAYGPPGGGGGSFQRFPAPPPPFPATQNPPPSGPPPPQTLAGHLSPPMSLRPQQPMGPGGYASPPGPGFQQSVPPVNPSYSGVGPYFPGYPSNQAPPVSFQSSSQGPRPTYPPQTGGFG